MNQILKLGAKIGQAVKRNKTEILEELGDGAYGTVFLLQVGTFKFARKIVNKGSVCNEYEKMKLLEGIEGIPKVYKLDSKFGEYYDMEYFEGAISLNKIRNELTLDDCFLICLRVIEIMQQAHERGVVHRDIKLENVLFNLRTKQVYLIDWGTALIFKQKINLRDAGKYGTLPINPIEFFTSNIYNDYTKIDVWQIGVLFIESITKKDAFGESEETIVNNIVSCSWEKSSLEQINSSLVKLFDDVFVPECNRLSINQLYMGIKSMRNK